MNNYKSSIKALCQLYSMLCAIAIALLVNSYVNFDDILKLANCIVLILLVVRFFHGNIVFVNKNYFELENVNPGNMFVDLFLMLIQGLLIIAISLIETNKTYDLVIALICTDAIWMLFVVFRNNTSCPGVVSIAIKWLVSNLFTACIMLFLKITLNQEFTLNISNIIIVVINSIVNFYMCNIFLETERKCKNTCAASE